MGNENNSNDSSSDIFQQAAKKISKKISLSIKIKIGIALFAIATISIITIGAIASLTSVLTSNSSGGDTEIIGGNKALSPEVLKWKSKVEKCTQKYGVPEITPYVLAIMQVESGGTLPDLMQSSESAGLPPNTLSYDESIDQGVKYLASIFKKAKELGVANNLDAIVQTYNYGSNYISYLSNHKKQHSIATAEAYSKDVVAPSLGNSSGATYSYVNEVSIKFGKTYLYTNGGNYFYSELVKQYIGTTSNGTGGATNPSKFYSKMKKEMERFSGWPYVWGGKNPSTGFDCSGLTSYLYSFAAGISIESYTVTQYESSVAVSVSQAKAGDLIFFRGTYGAPDFISHVGIYVNSNTMFDSESSGIGYHDWTNSYWSAHSPEIRRVKQ